jgi:hypothetical protein
MSSPSSTSFQSPANSSVNETFNNVFGESFDTSLNESVEDAGEDTMQPDSLVEAFLEDARNVDLNKVMQ